VQAREIELHFPNATCQRDSGDRDGRASEPFEAGHDVGRELDVTVVMPDPVVEIFRESDRPSRRRAEAVPAFDELWHIALYPTQNRRVSQGLTFTHISEPHGDETVVVASSCWVRSYLFSRYRACVWPRGYLSRDEKAARVQGTCRFSHAAKGCLSVACEAIVTTDSRSGLRVTAPIGVQSRVQPDQRAGLRSRAWTYSRRIEMNNSAGVVLPMAKCGTIAERA
jgi:hypothetical protein